MIILWYFYIIILYVKMHTIEPYSAWRKHYIASEDTKSPFFGRIYSEFEFTNTIYNYYIHPQWDEFGSETLYLKILYVDYNIGFTIIEFIGEWNDTLYNDIMYLKREVIDHLISNGIDKFILIGENILNFHASDDSYYEDWFSDIENGWVFTVNFQSHVIEEFKSIGVDNYVVFIPGLNINWRNHKPTKIYEAINKTFLNKIGNI